VSLLEGETHLKPPRIDLCDLFAHRPDDEPDFANVKAQESIKRALEIAAAGANDVPTLYPVFHSHSRPFLDGSFFFCPTGAVIPSASPAALLTAPAGAYFSRDFCIELVIHKWA
jgi:hypothetical protein